MADQMTATGRFVAFLNDLRPCNKAMRAVEANMEVTQDLRKSVAKLETAIDRVAPAIEKIAANIDHDAPDDL